MIPWSHYSPEPGLEACELVTILRGKGFDKPWSIFINSGASGIYVRRCSFEGNPLFVEALEVHKGDTITVRLATGTLVTTLDFPVNLGVVFRFR